MLKRTLKHLDRQTVSPVAWKGNTRVRVDSRNYGVSQRERKSIRMHEVHREPPHNIQEKIRHQAVGDGDRLEPFDHLVLRRGLDTIRSEFL